MSLVAGIDSSTQSCTVVILDAATGEQVRSGRAPHPPGTEVDPAGWWEALQAALAAAGGLDGVEAIAVAGQQHGMVCLNADGQVVRPALLWNDTRSAQAAADLVAELGAQEWADATGTLPVAAIGQASGQDFVWTLEKGALVRRIVITGRHDLGMPPYDQRKDEKFKPMTNQEVADVVAFLAGWRKAGLR